MSVQEQPSRQSLNAFSVRQIERPLSSLTFQPGASMAPLLRQSLGARPYVGHLYAQQLTQAQRDPDNSTPQVGRNLDETPSCSSYQRTVSDKASTRSGADKKASARADKASARPTKVATSQQASADKSYVERLRDANLPVWKDNRKSEMSLASNARLKFSHVASPQRKPQGKQQKVRKSKEPPPGPSSCSATDIPSNEALAVPMYEAKGIASGIGTTGFFRPPVSRLSSTSQSQLQLLRIPSLMMFAPPQRGQLGCQSRPISCQPLVTGAVRALPTEVCAAPQATELAAHKAQPARRFADRKMQSMATKNLPAPPFR